jgi:hypothetical protein
MGTGRKFNKAPMTRPTKSEAARKRRHKVQRNRLVALGLDEAAVAKMDVKTIREMLRRPNRVKATV